MSIANVRYESLVSHIWTVCDDVRSVRHLVRYLDVHSTMCCYAHEQCMVRVPWFLFY